MNSDWLNSVVKLMRRDGGEIALTTQASIYLSGSMVSTVMAETREVLDVAVRADPMPQMSDLHDTLILQAGQLGLGRASAGKRVNLVLAPELYNLCMVEKPDVPDSELDEAVRWMIQEQVDYPVEDATVSTFLLPSSASRDRQMVFAVAMRTEYLRNLVAEIQASGLTLASIDISELSLRNLAWHCYPLADQSVGILRLTVNSGVINISRGDELYLARRLSGVPKSFSAQAWEEFRERLLLQVQRSIDYYESAMNQPHCNMLMVACTESWTERVCGHLSEMLPIPVRTLAEVLSGEVTLRMYNPELESVDWATISAAQSNALCAALPALGGVLRHRIADAHKATSGADAADAAEVAA